MTIAIDTNILLDILRRDPAHVDDSRRKIDEAVSAGEVIVSEVVYAELSPRLHDHVSVDQFLGQLGITLQPSSPPALHRAGTTFLQFLRGRQGFRCPKCGVGLDLACHACGSPLSLRQHILPDFMIGAHAQVHAGRLLTRDRGYYAKYFPDLVLV